MSLLKNRNNEFERKLQEQLDDTEFKPTESLWNRIDREVNRPEFEQRVEGKIGNYSITPYPETWEQIEAQLPPPAKSRRRWGAIWLGSLTVLFAVAFTAGYLLNKNGLGTEPIAQQLSANSAEQAAVKQAEKADSKEINLPTNQPVKKRITANASSPKTIESVVEVAKVLTQKNDVESVKSTTSKINGINAGVKVKSTQTNVTANNSARLHKQVVSKNSSTPPTKPDVTTPQLANTTTFATEKSTPELMESDTKSKNTLASSTKTLMPLDTPPQPQSQPQSQPQPTATKIAPITDSAIAMQQTPNDASKPSKTSITILVGANYGFITLKDPNGTFAENIALRKQIESSNIDWSGGFLVDYKLGEKWLVSSGIQFTHLSMSMSYGTATASQQPAIGQGGNLILTDSVTQSGTNNLRIKYSWNEIPLLFTHKFNPTKRLGLETKFGLSYAIVNVVDAAMVAQNNVGVYNLKSKDAFPGFNNLLFAQVYFGVNYKLNESVTLLALPYVKYSLNNMIANENWVKQYPYMIGMSVGLRKSF